MQNVVDMHSHRHDVLSVNYVLLQFQAQETTLIDKEYR